MRPLSLLRGAIAAWKSAGTVQIAPSVWIGHGAVIEVDRGGVLEVGARARIGPGARILVRSGLVQIGAGAELLERASIVALEGVTLGADSRLGEMAVVMDFAAPLQAGVEVPLRTLGVSRAPVSIGAEATIGAKAVIGPGALVAERAQVLPGSTVQATAAG